MQPPQPPYGGPPPPPGMGGYGPGGYGPPPGPPGPPGWGPPGPPRRNNNGAAIVIVIIAAVVVLVGGVAGVVWLFNTGEHAASAVASGEPSFPALPTFDTPPVPSFSPPPSFPPDDTPSSAPVFDPQPGDCVRNTGTFHKPILHDSTCTPGHYRVLDRIDGTTNKNRCNGTGYTYAVWYQEPEFLLCLRRL